MFKKTGSRPIPADNAIDLSPYISPGKPLKLTGDDFSYVQRIQTSQWVDDKWVKGTVQSINPKQGYIDIGYIMGKGSSPGPEEKKEEPEHAVSAIEDSERLASLEKGAADMSEKARAFALEVDERYELIGEIEHKLEWSQKLVDKEHERIDEMKREFELEKKKWQENKVAEEQRLKQESSALAAQKEVRTTTNSASRYKILFKLFTGILKAISGTRRAD